MTKLTIAALLSMLLALVASVGAFQPPVTGNRLSQSPTQLFMSEEAKRTGVVKWYVPESKVGFDAVLVFCLIPNQLINPLCVNGNLFACFITRLFSTVRFNTLKGYGFIVPDDGTQDLFVHQTEIQCEGFRSLADGEAVEFFVEEDDKGKSKAVEVSGPGGAPVKGVPKPANDFDRY